jgi:hypothetical protein
LAPEFPVVTTTLLKVRLVKFEVAPDVMVNTSAGAVDVNVTVPELGVTIIELSAIPPEGVVNVVPDVLTLRFVPASAPPRVAEAVTFRTSVVVLSGRNPFASYVIKFAKSVPVAEVICPAHGTTLRVVPDEVVSGVRLEKK